MITYETLRKIEQEEKLAGKLAKLPDSFITEVMEYLSNKEAIASEKGDDIEYQGAKQRFQSITQMRERKILSFTLSYVRSGSIPENMTPEERELFDSVVKSLEDYHGKKKKALSGEKFNFLPVAFLQDIPQFVGIDMGYYGPYKSGDIATVPEDNAKLLVEKGAGELVTPG